MLLVPGVGGHILWVEDEFIPTAGQTVFTLSSGPTDSNSTVVVVNGVIADDTTDYTVSGTTLTWLDTEHTLNGSDKLLVRYQ